MPTFDEVDQALLDARLEFWNARKGPRVGDFVIMPGGYRRFTHDWGDGIQTTCEGGDGSFYLDRSGFMSYSGGLDPAIAKSRLVETGGMRVGTAWFFHRDERRAHNGVTVQVPCRVYRYDPTK